MMSIIRSNYISVQLDIGLSNLTRMFVTTYFKANHTHFSKVHSKINRAIPTYYYYLRTVNIQIKFQPYIIRPNSLVANKLQARRPRQQALHSQIIHSRNPSKASSLRPERAVRVILNYSGPSKTFRNRKLFPFVVCGLCS